MGFDLNVSVSAATVFLQGLLSFFSPCVLPLLPLYIGYLSGGAAVEEDDATRLNRGRVMLNTVFFVLGVSFAFFLLGLGMSALGMFFGRHQALFARIGGVIVILFGLYQLGVFGQRRIIETERRLPLQLDRMAMSPLTALVMGFAFSFAWTPCVGPALTSVLLLAASMASRAAGFALIGVYTLGFVIPFLAVGLFSTSLLALFKKRQGVVRWTVKLGGVLMLLMGVMMVTGLMNRVSSVLADVSAPASERIVETASPAVQETPEPAATETPAPTATPAPAEEEEETFPAPDFILYDQYGYEHRLSDYQGQVVFLNFWATWCPPCRAEMPDIQKLYEKYSGDPDSGVAILGVAFPGLSGETDEQGVADFLEENGYTYPTVMDSSGTLMREYYITAFPTTFMISADGTIYGYVAGSLTEEIMEEIISQTIDAAG